MGVAAVITDARVKAALAAFYDDDSRNTWPYGVYAFMRAALEAAERAAWEPIETAPKSTVDENGRVQGVYLLGYCPDEAVDPASCLSVIWWEPLTDGGIWYGQEAIEVRPTMWRHITLPEPPREHVGAATPNQPTSP